ncbi:MAG: S8 family serine peptidase [Ilumatobacteraceae bacterium]
MNNQSTTPAKGATWGGRPQRGVHNRLRRVVIVAAAIGSVVPAVGFAHAVSAGNGYDAANDNNSMKSLTEMIGATDFWAQGYTGAGIDVAIIDTGVSPVEGLAGEGKIIHGPDLSLESQAPNLAHLDTNGHGTFMAGVIAGHDSDLTEPYADAPATAYRGIAPDARIVSVKVGTADGGVDVTQVIAAINWVVDHKNDNGMDIRVLNLSYGTNSTQSYLSDPLSHAAERAWKAGIVVVAAAGNTGYQRGGSAPGLADPAYNPYVLAVGGYDTRGTWAERDDVMGNYSASANVRGARKPDVAAAGTKVQGLRVPNSFIDAQHELGRLGDRYFRGSGTSEAAAVASGTVALLLQKYPWMPPDQVKRMLKSNARWLRNADAASQGSGAINCWWLAWAEAPVTYGQYHPSADGLGSVELARGRDHLTLNGVVLSGEVDIFGMPFSPGASGSTWSGGDWNGSSWSGSSWSGSSWSGSSWSGSSWSGSSWSGSSWSGSSWSGSSWSGSSWSGGVWASDYWG